MIRILNWIIFHQQTICIMWSSLNFPVFSTPTSASIIILRHAMHQDENEVKKNNYISKLEQSLWFLL